MDLINLSPELVWRISFVLCGLALVHQFWVEKRAIILQIIVICHWIILCASCIFLVLVFLYVLLSLLPGNDYDRYEMLDRVFGPYWFSFWSALLCLGFVPQLLWLNRFIRNFWVFAILAPFLLLYIYQDLFIETGACEMIR